LVLDRSYREIARVRADGFKGDHHEFLITSRDTALILIFDEVGADLSRAGGRTDGAAIEGVIQEIDIATGEVLFEWHSLDYVAPEESYTELSPDQPGAYDYFHVNSIDVDDDDNLLVSAKAVNTIYKIDRRTGEVIWRLGGKKSDFEMGPDTRFVRQHDARRQADGTITLFDNGEPETYKESFGMVLELDMDDMTAELARRYTHPDGIYADNQANMQVLPDGNVFIGWGSEPFFSEFSGDGQLLYSANLPPEAESYRAFRYPWSGQPLDKPAVAAESGSNDETSVYVSWNGATEVANWQVLAGPGPDQLTPTGSAVPRDGFETSIPVNTSESHVSVQGRDSSDKVLGTSETIEL
ncbi:MAG: arylsulfotransferase family protein, partial [Rubrobacteraceae bacterium]